MERNGKETLDPLMTWEAIRNGCYICFLLSNNSYGSELNGQIIPVDELRPMHNVFEMLRKTLVNWQLRPADDLVIRDSQALLAVFDQNPGSVKQMDAFLAPDESGWCSVRSRLVEHSRSLEDRNNALQARCRQGAEESSGVACQQTASVAHNDSDAMPDPAGSRKGDDAPSATEREERTQERRRLEDNQDKLLRAALRLCGEGGMIALPTDGEGFTELDPPEAIQVNVDRSKKSDVVRISGAITGFLKSHNAIIVDDRYAVEMARVGEMSEVELARMVGKRFNELVQMQRGALTLSRYETAKDDFFK